MHEPGSESPGRNLPPLLRHRARVRRELLRSALFASASMRRPAARRRPITLSGSRRAAPPVSCICQKAALHRLRKKRRAPNTKEFRSLTTRMRRGAGTPHCPRRSAQPRWRATAPQPHPQPHHRLRRLASRLRVQARRLASRKLTPGQSQAQWNRQARRFPVRRLQLAARLVTQPVQYDPVAAASPPLSRKSARQSRALSLALPEDQPQRQAQRRLRAEDQPQHQAQRRVHAALGFIDCGQ